MDQPQPPLTRWRKAKGWTLDQAAREFGLKSKGYLSDIEKGTGCSVAVALDIERATGGEVPAATLNPDVALVESARGLAA